MKMPLVHFELSDVDRHGGANRYNLEKQHYII
jgi:hypothetical protein